MKRGINLLLLLLSFVIVGCGTTQSSSNDISSMPPVSENKDSTISTRPNDFLEDPDLVEDEEAAVDTAPEDTGELKEYRFEFESARYDGVSNNKDHRCIPHSIEVNSAFSGNGCVKNINGGASFVYTFNSDKHVRAPITIYCSNEYNAGEQFSKSFVITINGQEFSETGILAETGTVPDGYNATYFTMVEVAGKISIQEGVNTLKFTATTNFCPNMDALVIKTSANLEDNTKSNWGNVFESSTVTLMPTEETTGKIKFNCDINNNDKAYEKIIPNLKSELYKTESTDTVDTLLLKFGNQYQPLIEKYLLKLQDAKFNDGTTEMKVEKGSKPTLVLDNNKQGIHKGWVNVDDPTETYPIDFVMPNKSLTIRPIFEELKTSTLTVQNATFTDGSLSKNVQSMEEVTFNVDVPSGKTHVGWYDVNSPATYFEGTTFIMVDYPITIAPVFKQNTYVKSGNGYLDLGEVSTSSTSGFADNISGLTFVDRVVAPGITHSNTNRKTSHAGNGEYGLFLDFSVDKENAYFRLKTTYAVVANTTYEQTYTIYNFSNESITLTLDQVTSGTTSAGFKETITIESNKTAIVTLEYKFGDKNNHSLVVFRFPKVMSDVKLGVTSSIVTK